MECTETTEEVAGAFMPEEVHSLKQNCDQHVLCLTAVCEVHDGYLALSVAGGLD